MLVSNFAVGYYSPDYRWGDYTEWTARYALQITNLETTQITFGVESWITNQYFGGALPAESDEMLLGKLLGYEWHKVREYTVGGGAIGSVFFNYRSLDILPNCSETFRIWPHNPNLGRSVTPTVEGYVSLRVPVTRSMTAPYGLAPQSNDPVRVLLSAWREDWQRKRDPSQPEVELTASQSSVQLASGKAYHEIPPDTSLFVQPHWLSKYVSGLATVTAATKAAKGAMGMREEDAAQTLIDLLAQLGNDETEIEALNKALQDLRASVILQVNRR